MVQEITRPGQGYVDGIPTFIQRDDIPNTLYMASQKELSDDDPLEGRAYLLMRELPDAKEGTVLRPTIDLKTGKLSEGTGEGMYGYLSKYTGRAHFLHMEIVHRENKWFWRIN